MKKYNLSNIMRIAWELVRSAALTISEALKKPGRRQRVWERIW